MRILIIEDEKKMAKCLKRGFQENAFAVDLAYNGADGLHMATHENYDIILLDIMLPEYDGREILKTLRDEGIHTQVIFITAKDALDDRINGLNIGADDYIVKPFFFSELLARVRARLRRHDGDAFAALKAGDLRLDTVLRKVFCQNNEIELTPYEFSILEYLMRNPGRVLTRTMISEHVWDSNFESFSNVVDVHISNLRNKIDKEFNRKFIHTVRSVGYVLKKNG